MQLPWAKVLCIILLFKILLNEGHRDKILSSFRKTNSRAIKMMLKRKLYSSPTMIFLQAHYFIFSNEDAYREYRFNYVNMSLKSAWMRKQGCIEIDSRSLCEQLPIVGVFNRYHLDVVSGSKTAVHHVLFPVKRFALQQAFPSSISPRWVSEHSIFLSYNAHLM